MTFVGAKLNSDISEKLRHFGAWVRTADDQGVWLIQYSPNYSRVLERATNSGLLAQFLRTKT